MIYFYQEICKLEIPNCVVCEYMGLVDTARWWLLRLGCGVLMMVIIVVGYTISNSPVRWKERQTLLVVYDHSLPPLTNYTRIVQLDNNRYNSAQAQPNLNQSVTNAPATTTSHGVGVKRANDVGPSPSLLNDSLNLTTTGTVLLAPEPELTPPPIPNAFTPLTQREIEEVKTFVLFVGFARSGHSIVGTLLDAHPDIVIAHE